MENELYRIASFLKWPNDRELSISTIHLAVTGFYYSGVGCIVICFKCKLEIDCLTLIVDVIETHKRLSPRCQLVSGNRENNAASIVITNLEYQRSTKTDNSSNQQLEQIYNSAVTRAAGRSLYITDSEHQIGLTTTNTSNTIEPGFQQLNQLCSSSVSRATSRNLYVTDSEQLIDRSRPDFVKLRDEEVRLGTFFDWPQDAHADPQELAIEGFFYTGSQDKVQCVFCFVYIINWKATDIPSVEHKKHSPVCSFVRGPEVKNIRKTKETLPEVRSKRDSSAYGNSQPDTLNPQFKSLSIQPQRLSLMQENVRQLVAPNNQDSPKYPEYIHLSIRIASYKDRIIPRGQTPDNLAVAGFFHIGPGDKVMCFQCGGNLKDWEPKDDPWEEHRKWYPTCNHIKTRGASNSLASESSVPLVTSVALGSFPIEPREIKARMDMPMVRAVLTLGYDRDLIKKAIEIRLRTRGDDFPNAESLLEAIFALEDGAVPQASASSFPSPHSTEAASNTRSRPEVKNHELANLRPEAVSASSSRSSPQSDRSVYFSDSRSLPPTQTRPSPSVSSSTPDQLTLPAVPDVISSGAAVASSSETEPKSKGKRKKNKKKKTASAIPTATVTAEGQERIPPVQDNVDAEIPMGGGEHNHDETMDTETLAFVEENQRLREARTCKVCMDFEVNTVFLPCGHLVCCDKCSPELRNCPICRTFIRGTVRTFLS